MSFIHSIKFRFTLWYLTILGVLLVALSFGVYFYLSNSLYRNLDDSLNLRAEQIQTVPDVFASIREGEFEEELGEIVTLYFYSGDQLMAISRRDVSMAMNTRLIEQAIEGESSFATTRASDGQELRLLIVPFSSQGPGFMPGGPGGGMAGLSRPSLSDAALVIGRPTSEIDDALHGLVNTLLIAVPLTMLVAGAGGIFLARRALKPVDHIAQTAHEIEEKDLTRRIPVNTKDELG
ncbi:MAG: HAMP domain-containing protein, partial [Chloroflexi bacterium]|nr:HAMP domain-containing protein [Chloroflexota bacterium]